MNENEAKHQIEAYWNGGISVKYRMIMHDKLEWTNIPYGGLCIKCGLV